MRIQYSYYNFPFREEIGFWSILWKKVGPKFGDDNCYIKLQATITPNLEKLLYDLIEKGYLRKKLVDTFFTLQIQMQFLGLENIQTNELDQYTINVISCASHFCKKRQQTIIQSAHSFSSVLSLGNSYVSEKCMNKIKSTLLLDGEETLLRQLADHLKNNNIVLKKI